MLLFCADVVQRWQGPCKDSRRTGQHAFARCGALWQSGLPPDSHPYAPPFTSSMLMSVLYWTPPENGAPVDAVTHLSTQTPVQHFTSCTLHLLQATGTHT